MKYSKFIYVLLWGVLFLESALLFNKSVVLEFALKCILIIIQGILIFMYWKTIRSPFIEIRGVLDDSSNEYEGKIQELSEDKYAQELSFLIRDCAEYTIRRSNAEVFNKQSQLTALQTQINPHFLYNTLDTIRGMAMKYDNRDVSDMIGTLSSFFRYSISGKGSLVHVRDEINNINDYMKIQRYRFNNRFSVSIDIDEDSKQVYDLYIPRLILQPIVENAIIHGLDDVMDNAEITIDITVADVLLITVSDNGEGMTLQELDDLNEKIHSDDLRMLKQENQQSAGHGTGIALPNINKRIVLLYGRRYGLNVYSSKGYGTDVEIILPIDNHGEGINNEPDTFKGEQPEY
jgi:two-component system sensor histidine kinase YesM